MQHVLPGSNEVLINDSNIDSTTATWLNQSYASNSHVVAVEHLPHVDEEGEKHRIEQLENQQNLVSRERLQSWNFDVLEYSTEQLCEITVYMFSLVNLLDDFQVPLGVFKHFLGEIASRYIEKNTYHNFKHGVDVCHTTYRIIMLPQLNLVFSSLDVLAMLIGALAHDVGHLGVNNVFLVKTKHELALQHNDRSPLENMHCVVLYDVLSRNASNVFASLNDMQWKEARKIILTIILGTDMSELLLIICAIILARVDLTTLPTSLCPIGHHFEQISKSQVTILALDCSQLSKR